LNGLHAWSFALVFGLLGAVHGQEVAEAPVDLDAQLADFARAEAAFALADDAAPHRYAEAQAAFAGILAVDSGSTAARVGLLRLVEAEASAAAYREGVRFGEHPPPPERERVVEAAAAGDLPALVALLDSRLIYGREYEEAERARLEELFGDTDAHLGDLETRAPGSAWVRVLRVRNEDYQRRGELAWRVLDPWLQPRRGSLYLWRFVARCLALSMDEPLDDGFVAQLEEALSACPDSPLAPAIRLDLAQRLPPAEAWEVLTALEVAYPASDYWDDARWWRANLLNEWRWRERLDLYEGIMRRGVPGNFQGAACQQLVDSYLLLKRPADAWACLERLGPRADPGQVQRTLLALGRFEEAERRARARLEELTGLENASQAAVVRRHLGEALAGQGRQAEALDAFFVAGEHALSGRRLWVFVRCLLGVYTFPLLGNVFFLLLSLVAVVVASLTVYRNLRRARCAVPAGSLLAALVVGLHLSLSLRSGAPSLAVAFWLLSTGVHTLLLVCAGALLLRAAGVRMGAGLARRAPPQPGAPRRQGWARLGLATGVALGVMVALTAGLHALATPQLHPFFVRMQDYVPQSQFSILLGGEGQRMTWALLASMAAIHEEIMFRGLLLGLAVTTTRRVLRGRTSSRLARRLAEGCGVLLTSLLWAFPHAGMVDPEWWKMLQVTALGLVLGHLCLRRGLLAAIVAHVAFNLMAVLLS
jgi:membrane protease YdiL (CAAX protease family)